MEEGGGGRRRKNSLLCRRGGRIYVAFDLADFPLEHPDEPTDYAVDCLQLAEFILNTLSNDNFDEGKMHLVKPCLQQAIKYMGLA